jgi:hypothetical protein
MSRFGREQEAYRMEQTSTVQLNEFRELINAIRSETVFLLQTIVSAEDEKEEGEILSKFDNAIQTQVFSTLTNLVIYQLRGWRELIDE